VGRVDSRDERTRLSHRLVFDKQYISEQTVRNQFLVHLPLNDLFASGLKQASRKAYATCFAAVVQKWKLNL